RGRRCSERRIQLVDLGLIDLARMAETRAHRGVALELLAKGVELKRLDQVMNHPTLQRGAQRIDVVRGGDGDDVDRRTTGRMQLAKDLETRAVGKIDIQQHEVGPLSRDVRERVVRVVRHTCDRERWKSLEEATMDVRNAVIVLDDEGADHVRARGHVHALDGMSAVKTAPSSFETWTHPPRRCAICRTS